MEGGCNATAHALRGPALQLITTEEATQLLHRNVRAASGLGLDRLAPLNSPVPMGHAEPGHPPALSSPQTQRPHSQDSSSPFGLSSALSGAGDALLECTMFWHPPCSHI